MRGIDDARMQKSVQEGGSSHVGKKVVMDKVALWDTFVHSDLITPGAAKTAETAKTAKTTRSGILPVPPYRREL